MPLSHKHRLFVECFDGDIEKAARLAGFTGTSAALLEKGKELLANPDIVKALKFRSEMESKTMKVVADRQERQFFWSELMKNRDPYVDPAQPTEDGEPPKPIPLQLRIKASEMLGKSEADFIEKVEMNVQHSLADLITQAYAIPDEDIETIPFREVKQVEDQTEDDPTPNQEPPADVEDFI